MRLTKTSDLWWKNAVVYCLDVETYADADGDGCGDFRGLTDKLDYLEWLGVDCLWVPPFFTSPLRDGGYDVADYTGMQPEVGTVEASISVPDPGAASAPHPLSTRTAAAAPASPRSREPAVRWVSAEARALDVVMPVGR